MPMREDMVARKGMDIVISGASGKYSLKFPLGRLFRSLSALVPMTLMLCATANAQTVGEGGGASISAPPAERFAISDGGVDMRTGRYAYSVTDLAAGDMSLTRQVSGGVPFHIDPFGQFSHNWDITLRIDNVDVLNGNYQSGSGSDPRAYISYGGRSSTFEKLWSDSNFSKVSKDEHAVLTLSGSIYTYRNEAATVIFRPVAPNSCAGTFVCAQASSITLADGTHYDLEYDAGTGNTARLRSVSGSRGFALVLEYGGTGGDWDHVSKACIVNTAVQVQPANNVCPTGALTASYSYTAFGGRKMMSGATDPMGGVSQFSYSGTASNYEMRFRNAGESQDWLINTIQVLPTNDGGEEHIVTTQALADGRSYSYSYNYSPQIEGQFPQIAGGVYQNNLGHWVQVEYAWPIKPAPPSSTPTTCCELNYQLTPGPVKIVDALGRQSTYDYCDPNAMANLPSSYMNRCLVTDLQSFTEPEGNSTYFERDLATNTVSRTTSKAKPGSGLADVVIFGPKNCSTQTLLWCSKPSFVDDGRGNRTEFSYSDVHGGILKQTLPPDASGVRPETRYSYAQLYAWVKNGSGYVQVASPVWVLASEEYCKTGAADANGNCAVGAADEVVTTYEYQNGSSSKGSNLLLLGTAVSSDGQSLRTCYGYDQYGRRISETQPLAGLVSCQ